VDYLTGYSDGYFDALTGVEVSTAPTGDYATGYIAGFDAAQNYTTSKGIAA
jgi:hypothetical protein